MAAPAFTAILLAVTFWQLPGHSLLWRELQNTGHTLLFGLLALLALCSYAAAAPSGWQTPCRSYLSAGGACLLAGAGVEIVQLMTRGDADLLDVVRDLAGILIALGICACVDPRPARPGVAVRDSVSRTALLAVAGGLCIASVYPLAALSWAYHLRTQAFPVIVDPTASWTRPFLQLRQARLEPAADPSVCLAPAGERLARLQLAPAPYAGITVIEPYPDWTGYDVLAIGIYSAQTGPRQLTLRIHDARHDQSFTDRFNRVLTLAPGYNRIAVPLDQVRQAPARRQMDMAGIAGVMLFAAGPSSPMTFCLTSLRLE